MLSVAIFAKDEEAHIERCLKSLQPLSPEIIFVDTGSTDKTVKIAKKYTSHIYHEPWRNDFGWHRNHSFDLCTQDWILQIDADEELVFDNPNVPDILLKSLKYTKKEIHAIGLTIKDWHQSKQKSLVESDVVRIFRRGKVNWVRRIHNEAMFSGEAAIFKSAHLVHYGYNNLTPEQTKKKSKRTIGLLKESLKDNPKDYESLFYIAQAYGFYENDTEKAAQYALQYISHKDEIGERFNTSIYHLMAFLHLSQQKYKDAKLIIQDALEHDPMDLDIIYDWIVYGIKIGDPKVIAIASQRFVYVFENMPQLRMKTGGRFFFNYNLDSYSKALYYLSISYLETGVIELNKLKDLFKKMPYETVSKIKSKLINDFKHLKIQGLIDEPKIIPGFKPFDSLMPISSQNTLP